MASENVIHIKLDYEESLRAKRDILSSEISSLKIAKRIGRYRFLRLEELKLKAKVYGKMKEEKINIKKLRALLPAPKMPRILRKEYVMEEHLEKTKNTTEQQEDIESQLREIQRRLEQLQG